MKRTVEPMTFEVSADQVSKDTERNTSAQTFDYRFE